MTRERDELALIIMSPESFDGGPASCGPNDVYAARTADAILAAGYRRPRQVAAIEELGNLPHGSVIRSSRHQFWVAHKEDDGRGDQSWSAAGTGATPNLSDWLPATVLHVGGA
jgi:hypothetical protein